MGCPSGVCNTGMRVKDLGHIWLLLLDELLQLDNLSDLLESKDLILLVSIYGQAGTVISSVFQLSNILAFVQVGVVDSVFEIRSSEGLNILERVHSQGSL